MSTPNPPETPAVHFRDLALSEPLLKALNDVGYESASPIQAATIPPLLEGRDVLGQAQTGTGKTAAFALPILAKIDLRKAFPQALVLAPTRELAIQVAEAFQKYAKHLPGFHVLPIYGGQSYGPQLAALRRGVHVVVGTPGRVIDHMEKGTLRLDALSWLVLDEADEMLRMGFIDDVEKILKKTPANRQVALFSATMPSVIRRIAQTYLKSPAEITVKSKTTTVANTRQRYWLATGNKLDALTRILEAEPFDGMIIFNRTKQGTTELAEKLEARGFAVAPLNGDIDQKLRERTVARLKNGELDIIVATDVAARGLDVERISHVVNYDIPNDTESYVHRIGRTGRAGRKGEAILFVVPRERHMLKMIERATRQTITPMELPTEADIADLRSAKFKEKITQALAEPKNATSLGKYRGVLEKYEREQKVAALDIAAALAHLLQGDIPTPQPISAPAATPSYRERSSSPPRHARSESRGESRDERPRERPQRSGGRETGKETYRIEVGHQHGVKPGNIVGAIANEAGLDSANIGRIEIFDDHSLIDLPEGMPKDILHLLQKVWVVGQKLRISKAGAGGGASPKPAHSFKHKKPFHKPKH
ncbi:MAG: DEAD/DEAH box helicase [Pseudomonadota bacterium]